jgi:hypothetical protein
MNKIHIDSDGTPKGTFVFVDDQKLDNISRLNIYMNAQTGTATCSLVLFHVPFHIKGSIDVRKKEVG